MLTVLLVTGLPALCAGAPSPGEEKRAKVCASAEKRYQDLFAKPSASEDVYIVKMYKYNFCPHRLEVEKGATIRWVNVDRRTSHSIWFKLAGKPESVRLFPEESVELTFDMPAGEYPYLCGPHWENEGMRGTITVVE